MSKYRALLIPIAAIGLVVLAMVAPSGSSSPRPPSRVTVTESSYACPASSVITVAAGQVKAGTDAIATVSPDDTRVSALEDATTWRTSDVDGEGVVVQQGGRGSGAVGFFAGTASKKGGGGLVVGSCPGVVDDAWLMGLGSGGKHFSTLILTNLADTPAAVDLTLWGPKGEIDAVGSEGIVVKPSSVRRIRLDELAAGEAELAMHVHRRRGSLSAVVTDSATSVFQGTEQVSATLSPRRAQVVGGVVKDSSGRTLLLLNPGTTTARVGVQVIGPKNTFAPSGLDQIKVPAGSTRSIPVPKSAGSDSLALRLTSDQPVSASVRMAPGNKDYAYAEASLPLTGPAIVPIEVGSNIGAPRLLLTATGSTATADVEAFDKSMRPLASSSVTIKGGTTTYLALDAKDAAYFVVRPHGKVIAAATYAKGDGISSLMLEAAPVTVLGPQVRPVS
ncbi:hypothetical protein C6I20_11360 [Aeromicrobium sp. A1-2]|uniref:DUF5719 family protein n=1 Tax=Aeromicrobium sp. A1-2 TaxID=2107713 RepID=UPI000E4B6F46|nr:DUF5719 family protein [Aeromicrobium sp. A1-2]AXT85726.1 hypothetical protein C6I20_11360 [Aeromicrobium sp. A1-2]